MGKLERKRAATSLQAQGALRKHELKVPASLFGLSIGGKGCNIEKARAVPGITNIKADTATTTFHIEGTAGAIPKAIEILKYMEDGVEVMKNLISKVIGRGGKIIREILQQTGVYRYKLEKVNTCNNKLLLKFVGTEKQVLAAKNFVTYYIQDLTELELTEQSNNNLRDRISRFSEGRCLRPRNRT